MFVAKIPRRVEAPLADPVQQQSAGAILESPDVEILRHRQHPQTVPAESKGGSHLARRPRRAVGETAGTIAGKVIRPAQR